MAIFIPENKKPSAVALLAILLDGGLGLSAAKFIGAL
jgi:hypothetical protein